MQQLGEPSFVTTNVVFKEVLLNNSVTAPASEDEWVEWSVGPGSGGPGTGVQELEDQGLGDQGLGDQGLGD